VLQRLGRDERSFTLNHLVVSPVQKGSGKRAVLALLVAALGLTLIPGVADAKGKGEKKGQDVTVMTRNVYLGADLSPGLAAGDPDELADAAGVVVNQVDATNFPLRAQALGSEIKTRKPDLVGLQEVALWREATPPNLLAALDPSATQVEYDFLSLLLDQVNNGKCSKGGKKKGKSSAKKKKGKPCLRYKAVVVNEEFDFETPVNDDGQGAGLAGADRNARLTMRDVILVKQNAGIKTRNLSQGTFPTLLSVEVSGVPIDVTRGWTSLEAKVRGGDWFKFVNLHHEAFDSGPANTTNQATTVGQGEVREAQAQSLIAPGGPATGKLPVVIVGDLNSDDDTVGNDGDVLAYNAYIAGGFRPVDTSSPLSCCLSDPNLVGGSLADFDHHIDHVLTNSGKVKFKKGFVTGLGPVNGLYPSDHAGVTSLLNVPAAGGKKK
jgi:endonuclease/exonuclease/phosphatase family metal-dependent hydrolase